MPCSATSSHSPMASPAPAPPGRTPASTSAAADSSPRHRRPWNRPSSGRVTRTTFPSRPVAAEFLRQALAQSRARPKVVSGLQSLYERHRPADSESLNAMHSHTERHHPWNTSRSAIDNYVATITLNRPEKLNAVTPAMSDALVAPIQEFNARDDVRVLVLTGAGEKAFCAGSDIARAGHLQQPVGVPQPPRLLRRDPRLAQACRVRDQRLRAGRRPGDGHVLRHPHRGGSRATGRRPR